MGERNRKYVSICVPLPQATPTQKTFWGTLTNASIQKGCGSATKGKACVLYVVNIHYFPQKMLLHARRRSRPNLSVPRQ